RDDLVTGVQTCALPISAALEGIVLAGAAIVSITLCHSTDNPPAILAFLLAQAAIAVLVRRRWAWAEVVGLAGAAFSVFAWMDALDRKSTRLNSSHQVSS